MHAGAAPAAALLRNGRMDAADAAAVPAAAPPAPCALANGNGHMANGAGLGADGPPAAANGARGQGCLDASPLLAAPSGELGACEGELGAFELVAPAAAGGGGAGPRGAPPPPPLSLEEWGSFLTSEGAPRPCGRLCAKAMYGVAFALPGSVPCWHVSSSAVAGCVAKPAIRALDLC